MVSALEKLDDASGAWDQMLRDYVVPAMQNGAYPADLFDGFTELLQSSQRAEARADDVERRRNEASLEFDPHNAPGERLADVSTWQPIEGRATVADGEAPAHTLLDPEQKSTEIVTGTWARGLIDEPVEPQSWQHLATEVYSLPTHKLAGEGFGDELSGRERFEHVLSWSDAEWATLDQTLAGVKSMRRDDEATRRRAWAHAVVTEAAADGEHFSWRPDWNESAVLATDAGVVFDAAPVVEAVLAGDVSAARQAMQQLA